MAGYYEQEWTEDWNPPDRDKDIGVVEIYGYKDNLAQTLLEVIVESIHQDYEGWSESERKTIIRYLRDLHVGVEAMG